MLADDLRVAANIDLADVFGDLAATFTGADFGTLRFDPTAILDLVARVGPPDLTGVLGAVQSISGQVGAGLDIPGGELPGMLDQLTSSLAQIGSVFPEVDVDSTTGLHGLAGRVGA